MSGMHAPQAQLMIPFSAPPRYLGEPIRCIKVLGKNSKAFDAGAIAYCLGAPHNGDYSGRPDSFNAGYLTMEAHVVCPPLDGVPQHYTFNVAWMARRAEELACR